MERLIAQRETFAYIEGARGSVSRGQLDSSVDTLHLTNNLKCPRSRSPSRGNRGKIAQSREQISLRLST